MATTTKVKTNKRANAGSKIKKITQEVTDLSNKQNIELYGEIVYWQVSGNKRLTDIANAMSNAGLNVQRLREIYPATAFGKIAHQLRDEGIFDRLDRQGKELVFQLTEKAIGFNQSIGEKEVQFNRKAFLRLDTETGTVTSNTHPDLAIRIESLIRDVQAQRTPTEIGYLIKNLLDDEVDIFPLREGSSGVFFAPESAKEFLNKIAYFCQDIGGILHRIPMIKDSGTRQSVASAVEIGINNMINDHMLAIDKLDLSCRADTIEKQYDRVQHTEVKLKVYQNVLGDRIRDLTAALDGARAKIKQKQEELVQYRNEALLCTVKVTSNKCLIWGYSISKIAKYLRHEKNWTKEKIVKLCKNMFGSRVCGPSVESMANVNKGYEDVTLTEKQLQQLDDIACSDPSSPMCESTQEYIIQE